MVVMLKVIADNHVINVKEEAAILTGLIDRADSDFHLSSLRYKEKFSFFLFQVNLY